MSIEGTATATATRSARRWPRGVRAASAANGSWIAIAAAWGFSVEAPGGSGADHISALPDDLLLQILAGLGCARAAANTSLLSRRWRGLWTRSPQLIFHQITPEQLHALGQIARTAPRCSAPLAPAELSVDIHADMTGCSDADAVDLTCPASTAQLR